MDVCSEISSPVVSPRISFSHDLNELDFVPIESDNHLHLNPSIDFDFCIGQALQISSADELFSNGRILPIQIQKAISPKQIDSSDSNPGDSDKNSKKKRLIEFLSAAGDDDEEEEAEEEKPAAKSFWQFRRSSSVNIDHGGRGAGGGLLRSLHFLTRSNSTGSVPNNPKAAASFAKVMRKQNSLKEAPINRRSASASGLNQYYHYNKPSLGKSRSHGNGVRISPVLNIAQTYTVSLFGIGSFFSTKKSKKKRK